MKQTFKNILANPKLAIGGALVIALIVGVASTLAHSKHKRELFAGITATTPTTETVATPAGTDLTLAFPTGGRIKTVSVKVGDTVAKGTLLASLDAENVLGAVTQAKGAYNAAVANYQKVLNGATSTAIDVAKTSVATAQSSLEETKKQQDRLVKNAYSTLLSQGLQALPENNDTTNTTVAPTLSGSYTKGVEGTISISSHQGGTGYFTLSGVVTGVGTISTSTPQPLGDSGLSVVFSASQTQPNWIITIPNKNASTYLTNFNAYQTALQAKDQAIASAQAALNQATANLTALQVAARPEDVAAAKAQVESTQGALQIAQGAYNNTVITAPENGTITKVSITAGTITTANTPAIELLTK